MIKYLFTTDSDILLNLLAVKRQNWQKISSLITHAWRQIKYTSLIMQHIIF